jgi:hypothetical protein
VLCAAETAALWAGRRTEQHQATGQVERLHGEAANVNAVPLADEERPLRRMSGLKCLLVDWSVQLRSGRHEAATAGTLLAAADGSNDAHAAIGSVNSNLDRSLEVLISDAILGREWLQGKCAAGRFSEER